MKTCIGNCNIKFWLRQHDRIGPFWWLRYVKQKSTMRESDFFFRLTPIDLFISRRNSTNSQHAKLSMGTFRNSVFPINFFSVLNFSFPKFAFMFEFSMSLTTVISSHHEDHHVVVMLAQCISVAHEPLFLLLRPCLLRRVVGWVRLLLPSWCACLGISVWESAENHSRININPLKIIENP